jgi:hypothetical protein
MAPAWLREATKSVASRNRSGSTRRWCDASRSSGARSKRHTERPAAARAADSCTLEAYRREEEGSLLIVTAHGIGRLRVPPFDAIELLWGDRFDPNAARGREE